MEKIEAIRSAIRSIKDAEFKIAELEKHDLEDGTGSQLETDRFIDQLLEVSGELDDILCSLEESEYQVESQGKENFDEDYDEDCDDWDEAGDGHDCECDECEEERKRMSVTYTKEMRQIAKERGWHLCTVKTPGFEIQGPFDEVEFRLIDNAASHVTIVSSGNKKPFDILKEEKLPSDVADVLEDFKLSIIRHRESKFEDVSRYTLLTVLNALRHFVLVAPKAADTKGKNQAP